MSEFLDIYFSEKQQAYVNYLLTRLGFRFGGELDEYIEKLASVARIHRNIRAIWPVAGDEGNNPPDYYWWDGEKYLPERYTLVDFLIDEYNLKRKKEYEINRNIRDHISATDLSDFTFCPIGFSIGKSFETTRLTTAETGIKLHENCRLGKRMDLEFEKPDDRPVDSEDKEDKISSHIDEENEAFFNEIRTSELIYSGHSSNSESKKFFRNEELNFLGQPDYVFRNARGEVFIVEEKFKREKHNGFDAFFRNHKVQLASYIYYLNHFNAKYGYLVYWMYDYADYGISYDRCKVLKLIRSDGTSSFLKSAYEGVKSFKQNRFYDLSNRMLYLKKCASCVYCMYCGHKNGRKKQVTLPYQRSFHDLFPAVYPEILKRKDQDENAA